MGLVGVTARIIWGVHNRRFARASSVLLAMSGFSVLAITAIAAAEAVGAPLLWLGSEAAGVSLLAWHVVAWLVVLEAAHPEAIGRTSGIMQGGIALGFAAGAPIAGALIDPTGSYPLVWTLTAGVFAVVTGVTWMIRWPPVGRGDDTRR